jgi:DNA-binding transcriptional ArsR family regulator
MSNYQNKNIKEFAKLFKALSNPNRLEIFMNLVSCCTPGVTGIQSSMDDAGCSCVGDLGKDLGIVPSTVSHHIKELHQAGLIHMERRGQKIECWIDSETKVALKDFFS